MARPAFGYRNAAGKKILGSTSVLKYVGFMDTDVLCGWAAKLARQGQDWKKVRSAAGEHGTFLHELCETRLPHELVEADRPKGCTDEAWEKLKLSYAAIREWVVRYEPRVVFAEEPLISEKFQFAGTPDGVAEFPRDFDLGGERIIAGEPWLFDYKTGSMIGAKEVCQMASYRQLLSECRGIDVKGAILLHAPTREPGYMRPVVVPPWALDLGWNIFRCGQDIAAAAPLLAGVTE